MIRSSSEVELVFERALATQRGLWLESLFRCGGEDVIVLSLGAWRMAHSPLVRIHSTCFAAQYLASVECDCREQLEMTLDSISSDGVGAVIFLEQDGRANGHEALMRAAVFAAEAGCTQGEAYQSLGYSADARSFANAASILCHLGVGSVTLMTNSPEKIRALTNVDIEVRRRKVVASQSTNPRFVDYYQKKAREGHQVATEDYQEVES